MKKPTYFSKKNNANRDKGNTQNRVSNFSDRPRGKKQDYAKVNGGVFVYSKPISVGELSKAINVPTPAIIKFLFMQGKAVTINQILDDEMIGTVCLEFGYDFKKEEIVDATHFENLEIEDDPKDLVERPAVVTVMGHVDHGKTTLIDAIRSSHIVDTEAGGISQAIGAYQKEIHGKKITFIDTPGHAAFAEMRARGASVTDIVILIVAADDGVMPQTIEAIGHAKAAGVPMIVAINKMDKPGANPRRVKEELLQHEVVLEEYGGDVMSVEISAKKKEGIDDLLDMVLLKAEMLELKANPNRFAMGTVLEANLDKGEGPKATLLVQNGTLQSTDYVVVGEIYGKIRRMSNEFRQVLKVATPSTPVSVIGLSGVPNAGDRFMAFPTEKEAREIAEKRALEKKAQTQAGSAAMSLNDLNNLINAGKITDINCVVKADTDGSAQALKASLEKLSNDKVRVKVLLAQAGAISESDILLASASHAIIFGFNVRPDARVRAKAEEEHVELRLHRIIYELLDEMEDAMKGMVKAELVEKVTGQAEVRHLYKVSKVGTIAGSYVTSGVIKAASKVRVLRDGVIVYEGALASLKRFKDDAKEVKEGYECGFTIENFNDIKEGDIVEGYEMVEKE
ncbi:MAG: translation initiation factor IF-2 [Bacilli bacterium]|jgi:translation initiation factor IF-2|nr:translation initiation factor IF-2 [Bacilli bacterium]MEE3442371.1 translation initiation factor IF-2 [Candidatus Enteromonas sp.]